MKFQKIEMIYSTNFRTGLTILCVVSVIYFLLVIRKFDSGVKTSNLSSDFNSSTSEEFNQQRAFVQDLISPIIKAKNTTVLKTEFFQYLASQLINTPYPGVENYTQYVMAKSNLKSLSYIKPLREDFGPVLNDVTSFQYPIGIEPCRYDLNKINFFLAIISGIGNFEKRESIRQTWLRHIHRFQSDVNGSSISISGYGFITGQTKDQQLQVQIEEESKKYGDILQVDIIDYYYNLTLKVVGLVNWLNSYCSRVDFVLKVDDDVYVNVRNLEAVTKTLNRTEKFVCGLLTSTPPQRGGKWKISHEDWPWSQYPLYPTGGAVLFPGIVIESLLAATQVTPYLPFDDTYLLGLCSEKADIQVRGSARLFAFGGTLDSCYVYNMVTWLTGSPSRMNSSHWASENFYNNVTQCIVVRDGKNQTVAPSDYLLRI